MFTMPPFIREPAEAYHARRDACTTSHQLIDFRWCPSYYKRKKAGLIGEHRGDAFAIGSATHCLVLEGREAFERQYVVGGPINPKTKKQYGSDTNKFREWAASQTRSVLSNEQYTLVAALAVAVASHDDAADILSSGTAEGVLRRKYCGRDCQIRCDWFSRYHGLPDLKTCDNLDNFYGDIEEYDYVAQMAFYRAIIRDVTHETVPVVLIAVEKKEPHRVGTFDIDSDWLDDEEFINRQAMKELTQCEADDCWPTLYERRRKLFHKLPR